MKLYRIAQYSGTSGLELREEPDPPAPRGREVVVRVRASSVNFRELMDVQGQLARIAPLPEQRIPGSDAAGEVVAIGAEVTRVKPGDRVATVFYADWIRGPIPRGMQFIGRSALRNDGTLTEMTVVREDELVHLPAHLSFEEAATLPCAGVTAWTSLFEHARIKPGDTILVEGSGGVAVFALQFAHMTGVRAIATTTTAGKQAKLREIGASETVVASTDRDWAAQVLDLTGGDGVDWAVSTAGGKALDGCVAATRPGGGVVMVGVRDAASGTKSSWGFQMRGVSLHPTRVGNRDHFEAMNRALGANGMHPVIDRVFDFADAAAAFDYFAAARHVGKVVIRH